MADFVTQLMSNSDHPTGGKSMFSSLAPYSHALRELFDTQARFQAHSLRTLMEAGETAMEQHVDALRTLFATTTVATRQWSNAGSACDWMNPVFHATALFAPDPDRAAVASAH
jgi:hypothetical protein